MYTIEFSFFYTFAVFFVTSMQPAMDFLSFDLIDFDVKHRVFPQNACAFIVNMASILTPKDTIPIFDALYEDDLGTPNDFEAVAFYRDFTRVMNSHLMTPSMQQQVLGYFQITFVTDLAIDLLCAEVFFKDSSKQKIKDLKTSLPKKHTKN